MGRPLRVKYAGAFYHITSLGNERKKIFLDDGDGKSFLKYLINCSQISLYPIKVTGEKK